MANHDEFVPSLDGINHINIYSNGKTWLGRRMSNFALSPFTHPLYGKFDSIEGLWYWLSVTETPANSAEREKLRNLSGYAAKRLGRELRGKDWVHSRRFAIDIMDGLDAKLKANPSLAEKLKESDLPFTHYYVFDDVVKRVNDGEWLIDYWEHKRRELKGRL